MNLLIDTNIILDILLEREKFKYSDLVLQQISLREDIFGFIAFHSISTIFYVLKRKNFSVKDIQLSMKGICSFLKIVACSHESIYKNILNSSYLQDAEDALQAECALSCNADYIITRNIKDFNTFNIVALTPEDFLKKYSF